jgi:hypothetical protein
MCAKAAALTALLAVSELALALSVLVRSLWIQISRLVPAIPLSSRTPSTSIPMSVSTVSTTVLHAQRRKEHVQSVLLRLLKIKRHLTAVALHRKHS